MTLRIPKILIMFFLDAFAEFFDDAHEAGELVDVEDCRSSVKTSEM